jgi:hypothetical protein
MNSGDFGKPEHWPRLYAAAALAGAVLGVLVGFELLPAIPPQVTAFLRRLGDKLIAVLVSVAGGAVAGLALAAVAHLGVVWQLRRRGKSRVD